MNRMFRNSFNLDRTVRLFLWIFAILIVLLLFKYLTPVLFPFFVAWLLAFILHPAVVFIQRKLKIRNRSLAVIVLLSSFFLVFCTIAYFLTPALINEVFKLKDFILNYTMEGSTASNGERWQLLLQRFLRENDIAQMLNHENLWEIIKEIFPHAWNLVNSTVNLCISIFAVFVSLLYLFFILRDYHQFNIFFMGLIPNEYKSFVNTLLTDMKNGMNNYYRGQFLVAFCVGILFAIGFNIIGMPMGTLMGIIIGIFNIVPYLQVIGIPPCILLMLVHAAETGSSPLYLLGALLLVFGLIQVFQDGFLVPKIMGKTMGLNAAVILLSLSVFGMLFGIVGFIIALPVTTLLISYYKRYILNPPSENAKTENK